MSCIIVLGCFRSGTSAVAGALHHMGVHMGKQFDSPNTNNLGGYWEDLSFKNLHKKFDSDDCDNPNLMNEYLDLIRNREKNFKLWGVKDPLLCTNLMRLVTNLTNQSKLIVCRRPASEVAFSMGKALKEKKYPMRFLPLAEFYINEMNKQLDQYRGPVLELDHSETLKNTNFHLRRIANFVGVSLNKKSLSFIINYKK